MEQRQIETVIEIRDLVQKIGKKTVLGGLSFTVHRGECLGIFGFRGAGKTSLLHVIAGIDKFSSGTVEVLGGNINKTQGYKKHLGLVTQEASLFQDLTAGENLDYIATLKNASLENIESVLDRLELKDYLREPASRLEPGIYQRLSLVCALLGSPQLLLTDELIKDIDLYSRQLIVKEMELYIKQGGSCACAFTNVEFAPYMSRVAWLDNGLMSFYEPGEFQDKINSLYRSFHQPGGVNDD